MAQHNSLPWRRKWRGMTYCREGCNNSRWKKKKERKRNVDVVYLEVLNKTPREEKYEKRTKEFPSRINKMNIFLFFLLFYSYRCIHNEALAWSTSIDSKITFNNLIQLKKETIYYFYLKKKRMFKNLLSCFCLVELFIEVL